MAQRHRVNDAGVKPLRADGNLFLICSAWEEQGSHVEWALLALATRRHSITCKADRGRLAFGGGGLDLACTKRIPTRRRTESLLRHLINHFITNSVR